MTENHPMVPPSEELKQWEDDWFDEEEHPDVLLIRAYQAGADAELEACINFVYDNELCDQYFYNNLRDARRPKPLSLKQQALAILDKAEDPSWDINDFSIVRRALEQLDD